MSENRKRFEELIGESVNPEKKPLYSEDFITDKETLKFINEQKQKEAEAQKMISESKEQTESEVEQFLAENLSQGKKEIISESTQDSDDETFVINL